MTPKLYSYQQEGRNFLKSRDRCLLADDMGLGKTAQTLSALPDRGLVICPPSLKYNWLDECNLWRPDLTPIVCEGMGLGRFKWPDKGQLVICGYNQIPDSFNPPPHKSGFASGDKSEKAKRARAKLKKARQDFQKFCESQEQFASWTVLVADEIQYVKNPKSKRSRKFRILSAMAKCTWGLTGTPMPRGNADDLYGILKSMHLEDRVFTNFAHFNRVAGFKYERKGHFTNKIPGTPTPEFHELVKLHMLRRTKEIAAPDLPPKSYRTLTVDLSKEATKALDSVPKDLVDRIKKIPGEQLIQVASLPEFSEFAKCRKLIARARIPALLEIVEMYEDQGIRPLVFSAHREPIEALAERENWGVIIGGMKAEDKQEICRKQKDLAGVALTIGAGNSGLNLASFSHMIFVDRGWDCTENAQAEDRMHRHGQTADNVFYTDLTSAHPLDKLVTEKLAKASRNIKIVIDGKEGI